MRLTLVFFDTYKYFQLRSDTKRNVVPTFPVISTTNLILHLKLNLRKLRKLTHLK